MKILCVIDSLGSGGAQRQLVELAKGFKERGYTVSFLVYHEENFFKGVLVERNIPVDLIIESNYVRRLFKIRKYIRKGNYDVVLSFLEAANFICEFAGFPFRSWKLIVGERSANPDILSWGRRRFYRWFHLFADYVVGNSHENLKMVRRINPFLPSHKCRVIYNLIDFNYWKPASDYSANTNENFHLVVVASHQYLKNAKGLIEGVANLSESEKKRVKVNWYGDERSDDSLQDALNLIDQLGLQDIFNFYNATNDIMNKMQYADVIGLFSLYEGLPNAICEAMILGKPIISSSVSDIPLLLSSNRNCIFDPHNPRDIARSLNYVLSLSSEELQKLGESNRLAGRLLFDKTKIISSYLALFA